MRALRIVEKPHIKFLSGLDIETSSVPLDSIPPNTHTPLKEIRKRWLQSLSIQRPSRTSALSTTLQSTLIPGSVDPPDFSDVSNVSFKLERQSTEPDAAKEVVARLRTRKSPLKPWNPNDFTGVFLNNQEKDLGRKQTQSLQDNLSAVDGSLRSTSSLSVFEDDVGHVEDEIPQEDQGIATAAKATSPKFAKQRLPGADQARETSDPQLEKERTSHDPLDDLYELPKIVIRIPRKERAPEVTLKKDNHPKQDNHSKQEDKVVLSEWFVKGVENKGVCVEGKRVDSEDLHWHSNIIVHCIEPHKVKTLTGRVYELQGHLDKDCMLQTGCPSWLVEKFEFGFPDNWKSYVPFFLQPLKSAEIPYQPEDPPSKDNVTKNVTKTTSGSCPDIKNKKPSSYTKWKNKISCRELELPVGEHEYEDRSRGNLSTQSLTTRSGRQVKPILRYWCGERLSVDFQLNTSIIRADRDALTESFERMHGLFPGRSNGKGGSSKSSSAKTKMLNKEELPVKKTNSRSQTLKNKQRNVKRCPLKPMSVMLTPLNTRQQIKKRCLQHQVRFHSLSSSNSSSNVSFRKTDFGYKKSTSSFPQDLEDSEASTLTESSKAESRSSNGIAITSEDENRSSSGIAITSEDENRSSSGITITSEDENRSSSGITITSEDESRSSSGITITSEDEREYSDDYPPSTIKQGKKYKKALQIKPNSFKTSMQQTVHPTGLQNCVRVSKRLKPKNSLSKDRVKEMQKSTLIRPLSGSPVLLANITEDSEEESLTWSKSPPHLQQILNSDLSDTSGTQTSGTEQPISDSKKPPKVEKVAILCENISKRAIRRKNEAILHKSTKQKAESVETSQNRKRMSPYSSKAQHLLRESQDSEGAAETWACRQVPNSQKSTLFKPTWKWNPVAESSHFEEVSNPLNSVRGIKRHLNSKKDNRQTSRSTQPLDDFETESSRDNLAWTEPCNKVAVPSRKPQSIFDFEESEVETVSRKDLSETVKSKNKIMLSTPSQQKGQNTNSQKSQRQAKKQENTKKHLTTKKIATKRSNPTASQRKTNLSEETSESELDFAEEEDDDKEDYESERKVKMKARGKTTKPSNQLQNFQKHQQTLRGNSVSKRLYRKSQNDDLDSESELEMVPWKDLHQTAKSKNKLLVLTPGSQKSQNTRSQKSQRGAIEQENSEKYFTQIGDAKKQSNPSSRKKKSSQKETSHSELDVEDEEDKSEEDYKPKRKANTEVNRKATKPSPQLQDFQKHQQNSRGNNASRSPTRSNPERQLPQNPFAALVHQEDWTEKEVKRLYSAVSKLPKRKPGYWFKVAMAVGSHSAEECQEKYLEKQQTKGSKSSKNKKESKGKEMVQFAVKEGTLKRKQQMQEFLDHTQRDDDLFSSTQTKRVKAPETHR